MFFPQEKVLMSSFLGKRKKKKEGGVCGRPYLLSSQEKGRRNRLNQKSTLAFTQKKERGGKKDTVFASWNESERKTGMNRGVTFERKKGKKCPTETEKRALRLPISEKEEKIGHVWTQILEKKKKKRHVLISSYLKGILLKYNISREKSDPSRDADLCRSEGKKRRRRKTDEAFGCVYFTDQKRKEPPFPPGKKKSPISYPRKLEKGKGE